MTSEPSGSTAISSFTLFAVILIVSVVLAISTDLGAVARGAIAVVLGIVAAAVVSAATGRRK